MSAPYGLFGTPGYEQLLAVLGAAEESHTRYERTCRPPGPGTGPGPLRRRARQDAEHRSPRRRHERGRHGPRSRYERFGEPADLDGAITLFREALAPYGTEVTVVTPSYWTNLSGALRLRWLRTHDARDLTASVYADRTALDSTPPGGARRSNRLDSLGDALLSLHHLHGDSAALAEAVGTFRAAVACAEPGTEEQTWARSNLAEALRLHHHQSPDGAPEALDEAAVLAREVLTAVPRRHRLYPRFLSSLASILAERHQVRADPADLREAALGRPPGGRRDPGGASQPGAAPRGAGERTASGTDRRGTCRRARTRGSRRWRRTAFDAPRTAGRARMGPGDRRGVRHHSRGTRCGLALLDGLRSGHAGGDRGRSARPRGGDPPVPEGRVRPHDGRQRPGGLRAPVGAEPRGGGESRSPDDHAAATEPFRLAVELLPRTASYRIGRMDRARRLGKFAGLAQDAAACALELADPNSRCGSWSRAVACCSPKPSTPARTPRTC